MVLRVNDVSYKKGAFKRNFKKYKKTIDNFPYRKYNHLVMQVGISKSISKRKRRVH